MSLPILNDNAGVRSPFSSFAFQSNPSRIKSRSMHAMSNLVDTLELNNQSNANGTIGVNGCTKKAVPKSYSVSADGSVSVLTPLQMGRHELYENIPFTAVFGMQKKERNLSRAFASYAADLDIIEADQKAVATTQQHLSHQDLEKRHSQAELIMMDQLELDNVMVTTPLIFAILVATMSQFLVGYNTGVMNAPENVVLTPHSTGIWGLAVAAFAVGGPFGANIAGNLADTRGRRGALLINTWLFLLGGLIQTLAIDMFSIIIARFIIGFASGFSSVLVPIYLGELAPPTLRGMLGTLTQFALVLGILVSDLLAFPLASPLKWRILFSVTAIVAIIQLFCAPWLLETPRWLLNRDTNSRKARYIIKQLRGFRTYEEVETEVGHFVSAIQAQTMKQHQNQNANNAPPTNHNNSNQKKQTDNNSNSNNNTTTIMELFQDKSVRLLVISCLVLQMSQQLCGINAVFYYSTSFFEGVIDNPLDGTTIVGGVNVLATYVALLLMDVVGRRTLILWSSGGMFVCCIFIVLSLLKYFPNIVALIAVNLYVSFFEIGLGPIPWLIVAEMFDAKYVATAMSASCQLNWACNFIVGITFPYMNNCLGPYSFVPFATVLLFAFIFAAIWLPETQGTTPEELQAELIRKNSTTVYHNLNIHESADSSLAINMEWRHAMEQLKKEEEEAMQSGNYNYGFQPIERGSIPSNRSNTPPTSDWQSVVSGVKQ
eukprot:CAMPEP_0184858844 /NCGR_PEP_ID=MMETSP0580-20130426/3880_1 /TAXON_ID=1118495 /ORGANISM="Dactyliosolen fragilissimus" /LENGTH=714 /DNA_ID=CAMNT_0027355169 /DNA_START=2155 /DNA_END=4299 /DNA_ORIENTATION=-